MTMHRHNFITTVAGILLSATLTVSQNMTDWAGQVFPPDHALNSAIDSLPVHPNSENYITAIGSNTALHPDFGTSWSDGDNEYPMGIPYNIVGAGQPEVPIEFYLYGNESDPGPWPIPQNPYIETVFDWHEETDGDRHMLIIDTASHTLYETGNVFGNTGGTSWRGGCGAVFNLDGYTLRTEEWTSADAAGLPIFPLLIRYDEVERAKAVNGDLHHAIRFTVQLSQKAYLWPARHYAASSTDQNRAPMGLRVRLKASFDLSGYTPRMQVILRTMKKYGMIVADNGSNWYFQGTHDNRWDDDEINSLKKLRGSNFEVVDITPWTQRSGFDKNSARVPPAAGQAVRNTAAPASVNAFSVKAQSSFDRGILHIAVTLPAEATLSIRAVMPDGKTVMPVAQFHARRGRTALAVQVTNTSGNMVKFLECTTDHGEKAYCTVPPVLR